MDSLWSDLGYALRGLRQAPGVTAIAVLTLGLGIGAVTAMFTVVNGVLLRPLPYPDADRIVAVRAIDLERPDRRSAFSVPDFAEYRRRNRTLETLAALRGGFFTLTDSGDPEQLWGLRVSAEFFDVMGKEPALGRRIMAGDDHPGAAKVTVLNHGFWQRRFGGDHMILGRSIELGGESHRVIGVMPPGFETSYQLFVPLALSFDDASRSRFFLFARARLRPGVDADEAQVELGAIAERLTAASPESLPASASVAVNRLREQIVGDVEPVLLMFNAAVALVLLIACANVANLLLARTAGRRQEMALRAALGASRGRLVRLLLAESVGLAAAGGLLGLALAGPATRWLLASSAAGVPRSGEVTIDGRVLLFTLVLALASGVAVGLLPLRRTLRLELAGSLRAGANAASHLCGVTRSRPASTLVTVEVALALVLSISAGLLVRSFGEMIRVEPGFDPGNVLTARINLPPAKYDGDERQAEFLRRLASRVSTVPGVERVGGVFPMPLTGGRVGRFFGIAGRPLPPPGEILQSSARAVLPGYFRAMGIPLRRGRAFSDDDRLDTPRVVVLNDSAARHFFPGEDALGQRITFDNLAEDDEVTWWTIVGVAGDVLQDSLTAGAEPVIYHSSLQRPMGGTFLTLRLGVDPATVVKPVRAELAALDPDLPLTAVRTLEEIVADSVARPRFNALLLGLFAGLALLLSALGVYALLSCSVARRRPEIGIRMALGAGPAAVLGEVLRRGMMPVAAGLAAGLCLAFAATRILSGMLYGVTAVDPMTYTTAAVLLAAIAAAACWLPARAAARVDPVTVLKVE